MIPTDKLVQSYIVQYEQESRRKQKNTSKAAGYPDRIGKLSVILKRGKAFRMNSVILEDYHRQIKNLAYHAYRQKDKGAIARVRGELIPQLVRLDLGLLLPEQKQELSEAFITYIETVAPGEICTRTLFDVYREYMQYSIQKKMLKLVPSNPEMEFPEALEMRRRFILHIGPTNSGKTFHALEHLKEAENGVYLGPLRLLALEVYEKMRDYGTPCTMRTGQECITEENSRVTASTIEMADFHQEYDVAVIDEAQMAADRERGHAWTKAILGIRAETIHICMSPIAEQVVLHLIQLCRDTYEIHRYKRKTELVCEGAPFVFPGDVQDGDALVVFSKKSVLDVAGRLEAQGIPASVIYGSLPPEIRRRQMRLFTARKTKVVVATDAIGMGLNLPVRRIVFVQTEKFDGVSRRPLTTQEIKQIAGRAGRYGIYNTGYVTAMGQESLEYIRERYEGEEEPIASISLGFPQVLLDMDEPLDVILNVWHSAAPSEPFEKVSIEETLFLYEQASRHRNMIEGFSDKHALYRMISCPIDIDDRQVVELWLDYCKTYTADVSLKHPDLNADTRVGIQKYETYYKKLDLYYQFSSRFGKIIDNSWLERERDRTEENIMRYLSKGKKEYIARCRYCGRMLPVGYAFRKCRRCSGNR